MQTRVDKNKENRRRSSETIGGIEQNNASAFQFVDMRPEAIQAKRLLSLAGIQASTLQRKVIIANQVQTPQTQPNLVEPWTTAVTDDIPRDFKDEQEFANFRAGSTDYIGTVKNKNNNWVRFDPSKKYVMGERHTEIVLSDFTTAVHSMNFQHERFSKLDQIKQEGYSKLAKQTEAINKDRYARYGVDIDTAVNINQFALESPMPKIAYCLESISNGLKPDNPKEQSSDYSVVGRMMTYLDLSFTIVEDLLDNIQKLQKPELIETACLKTTLKYILSGKIDYEAVKKTAKKDLTGKVDKGEMDNLVLYCNMFVIDTLRQGNLYADHTPDPSSKLVKSKKDNMGDLTNPVLPGEESNSEMLSYLRDEEMINHIRGDVRYVGMGDAHAKRLEPRLLQRGFKVVHVPDHDWKPINNF
jgi:hypothetical protein